MVPVSQSVSRLKELLFDSENATLAELQGRIQALAASEAAGRLELGQRVDLIFDRAGTEERFRTSVADVLDGALRDAEVKRHDQVARAIAPLVVKTIKTELRNSQDEMVEALYPITGRMVKAYVASAIRDLNAQINRRLAGDGTSPMMLRLRSLMTGRSVAELALAATQRLDIEELFLVRRGSGELVQHWPPSPVGSDLPSNSNIHLSGVLTAINEFAAQALKDDGGNLRSFSLDDFQMYLRGSQTFLLAAKCRGSAPAGVEAILDDGLLRVIEQNNAVLGKTGDGASQILARLAKTLNERLTEKQSELAAEAGLGFNPLKAVAAVIAVPLIAGIGWWGYTAFETARVRETVEATIAGTQSLVGYPTQIEVAPRGRMVTVSGIVPTFAVRDDVMDRLRKALPESTVRDGFVALPAGAAEIEPQIISVKRDLASFEAEVTRVSVRRTLARSARRLEQAGLELNLLDRALTKPEQRATVKQVRSVIEQSQTDVARYQGVLSTSVVDLARINALVVPVHTTANAVKKSGATVSALLTGSIATQPSSHTDGSPSDLGEAADELAGAAEQLASVVVAVSQAAHVKPIERPIVGPTARERLAVWVKSNAVFFSDGIDFRSPITADATLRSAATLFKEADMYVRIVGYTDERGGQTRNVPLAQARADRILEALVERGVARRRLVAIGRPTGADLSPAIGSQSPNRRVEFEIGFEGEVDAP